MSKAYSRNLRGFPPNSRADQRFRPAAFFAAKARADSTERSERKDWKRLELEKANFLKDMEGEK